MKKYLKLTTSEDIRDILGENKVVASQTSEETGQRSIDSENTDSSVAISIG